VWRKTIEKEFRKELSNIDCARWHTWCARCCIKVIWKHFSPQWTDLPKKKRQTKGRGSRVSPQGRCLVAKICASAARSGHTSERRQGLCCSRSLARLGHTRGGGDRAALNNLAIVYKTFGKEFRKELSNIDTAAVS
jgi:hypothetical protein